ncbi:PREDICTED: uncharacterized protein LOC105565365 [Vollenhovia emeryi]|uniref:uncharacterized protein LOC105565365 n=1 Tax=Vollenhovia emeryi TaxID=411798 RepID=UPI0005F506FC|nr:PREDICTED: uncharacterized protein LOC105565365 [Vollenhovia emeryi]
MGRSNQKYQEKEIGVSAIRGIKDRQRGTRKPFVGFQPNYEKISPDKVTVRSLNVSDNAVQHRYIRKIYYILNLRLCEFSTRVTNGKIGKARINDKSGYRKSDNTKGLIPCGI